jgi:MYXO-CTERM domain-containing protein
MNVKRASIFAGAVAGLAITSMATAGYEGMAFEIVRDGDEGRTYRLYAMMSDGDRLDAVAGNGQTSLNLTSVNGFYQDGAGGPTSLAINSNFFEFVPSMEWDSYVTVGALYADGTPFGSNGMNDVGMDFSGFEAGGDLSTNNGTWFVTPDLEQGNAIMHDNLGASGNDSGYGVLIAQVTTTTTGGIDGYFSGLLQGKDAAGDTWQATPSDFAYGGIPAPGALALLGLAGIAGRRRRRA